MVFWVKLTLVGASAIGVIVVLFIWFGSIRQHRNSAQFVEQLVQQASTPQQRGGVVRFDNFEQLPTPVARYFRQTLRDGQPLVRVARFHQKGELRTDETRDRWSPYEANQIVVPFPPGFMWDARVRIAPLLHVRVRDAYVAGQGSGQVSLLSAITISEEHGGGELSSGELYRYLAEAVWYPTALLPRDGLHWTPIDSNRALATLTESGSTVSIEFRFADNGEVTAIYTPARNRRVDGQYRPTPWEGHVRNYTQQGGMRIPAEAEVGWYLSGEWRPVWKGTITDVKYEFTQ